MPFRIEHALSLIRRSSEMGRLGHAYLITGPREVDLGDFALHFLRTVSGRGSHELSDFQREGTTVLSPEGKSRRIVIGDSGNPAPNTMRHFIHQFQMSNGGQLKPGLILDAERMNDSAQNAFLRTLEEPPRGALFLLLTHNPRALLPTTRSRVVEISLQASGGLRKFNSHEERLLAVLRQLSNRGTWGLSGAMTLKGDFQEILEELKADIKKEMEDDFKREQDHFKQTTDGNWLRQREEQMEAQASAAYQLQRDGLMDLLMAWMGDVTRQSVGADYLDLPADTEVTRGLAERWTPEEINRRLVALRKLDQLLRTNVSESLALEVCFIQAFG